MIDYKKAGVDIEAGDELVRWLQKTQPENPPHADRVVSGIGGFASLFRIDFPEMKEPCLVTGTDGVGTKIKLASYFDTYASVGQDVVAMCVNDLICCGAQPLLFLDYYATGKLELEKAKDFLTGVRNACTESGCMLVGGETAEMPGVYAPGDFDCAGFAVGIVDKSKSLGAHRVQFGQKLIAIASSGFHSNGFSLLRKVFEKDLDRWRDQLLEPTALYPRLVMALTKENLVESVAHITGGGMDNLLRVLPDGTEAVLKKWEWPETFKEVQRRAGISDQSMLETFNCGIGLVLVCKEENEKRAMAIAKDLGFKSFELGFLRRLENGSGSEEKKYSFSKS